MKKIIHICCSLPLCILLLAGCEKEGEPMETPIKELRPYTMEGFALAPVDQYFDGVKVGELYARANSNAKMAFYQDEVLMELKRKSDGKTVYQQKFNISDDINEVPKFYFDGTDLLPAYSYPAPVGKEYTANFYFDFPKDSGTVDVVIEMSEFYYDWGLDDPLVMIGTTTIPLVENIQPGKWSSYIKLDELPTPAHSRPDSEFWPFVCVKRSGRPGYYLNSKMEENSFQLEFPQSWTTEGKVQSIFIGWKQQGPAVSLQPQQDLVQLFP